MAKLSKKELNILKEKAKLSAEKVELTPYWKKRIEEQKQLLNK